jgi:endonuclease/exonuclease/phosphatase family metal-dependent hydrolase
MEADPGLESEWFPRTDSQPPQHRASVSRWNLLTVAPILLLGFAAVVKVHPPHTGPLAVGLVVEPHLFISVLVALAPIAILGRARFLALALVVTLAAGGLLFGSEWISLPGSGARYHNVSVMNWNVQHGARTPADQALQLEGVTVDLVALVELEPAAASAIEQDDVLTGHYPYRVMAPAEGAGGLALLSRYPISSANSTGDVAWLDLIVATPRGNVHVIVAHPTHATIVKRTRLGVPDSYRTANRDEAIAILRTRIDAELATNDRLLVLGDFNTSSSEAEYSVLTAGLRDTHVEVGEGPGWTWRASRLTFLPFGLLRIDYQLTAGAIVPASTSIDCALPGDHCRLFGDYEIDPLDAGSARDTP